MTWFVIERSGPKLFRPFYQTAKRVIDLIFCLIAIPVLLPLALIISIVISLDSPGPIFYIQKRIGKGGRVFNIFRFRTLYYEIDRKVHRSLMKAKEGYRWFEHKQITPIGRILRQTGLDEIPQLINVFRGEMSLVGPRPGALWEVEEHEGWYKEMPRVVPGITGLAQIRGRSDISLDEIVQYDLEYIHRQNLGLDLQILWWTMVSVLRRNNAR